MRAPPLWCLENWREYLRPCDAQCCSLLQNRMPSLYKYEPEDVEDTKELLKLGDLVDTGYGVKAICRCDDCNIPHISITLEREGITVFRSVYNFRNHMKKEHPLVFEYLDDEEYAWAVRHGKLRYLLARYLTIDKRIPNDLDFDERGPVCPVGNCSQSFEEALIPLDGSFRQHLLDVHTIKITSDEEWETAVMTDMQAQLEIQKVADDALDEADKLRKEADAAEKALEAVRREHALMDDLEATLAGWGASSHTVNATEVNATEVNPRPELPRRDSGSTVDSWTSTTYNVTPANTAVSAHFPAAPLNAALLQKIADMDELKKTFQLHQAKVPLSTAPKVVHGNERDPGRDVTDEEKREDGLRDPRGGQSGEKLMWRKVKMLGVGGFGTASLWILYDPSVGNIIQRVVVKEGFDGGTDARIERFEVPPGSGKLVPSEGILHKRMTDARQKYTAVLYHSTTLAYGRVTRLYLEHAPFSDLTQYSIYYRNGLIDEGFVWNVLHSLVSNLKTMRDGKGPKDKQWEPFLHRDIKGGNMLLVNARDKRSKQMNVPTPVLSDYGLAMRLPKRWPVPSSNDSVDPIDAWENTGTPGYCAPETISPAYGLIIGRKYVNVTPGVEADIYSIGCTAHALMQPGCTEREDWYDNYFNNGRELPNDMVDGVELNDEYSESLRRIVRECLRYKPADRITFDQLCALTKVGRDAYFASERPWPHFPDPLIVWPREDGKLKRDDYAVNKKVGALGLHLHADHGDVAKETFFQAYQQGVPEDEEDDEDEDEERSESESDDDEDDEDDDDEGRGRGDGGRRIKKVNNGRNDVPRPPPNAGAMLAQVGVPGPPPRRIPGVLQGGRIPALQPGRVPLGVPGVGGYGRGVSPPLPGIAPRNQGNALGPRVMGSRSPTYIPGSPEHGPKLPSSGIQQTGGAVQSPPGWQPQSPRNDASDPPPDWLARPQAAYGPNSPRYNPNSPNFVPQSPNRFFADLPEIPGASPVRPPTSNSNRQSPGRQPSSRPLSGGQTSQRQISGSQGSRRSPRTNQPQHDEQQSPHVSASRSKSKPQSKQDEGPWGTVQPSPKASQVDEPQASEPESPTAPPAPPAPPAPGRGRRQQPTPATAAAGRPRRDRNPPERYGEWVPEGGSRKRKIDDGAAGGAGGKRRK